MLAKTLTSKQKQWLAHVRAADAGHESIADYALTAITHSNVVLPPLAPP